MDQNEIMNNINGRFPSKKKPTFTNGKDIMDVYNIQGCVTGRFSSRKKSTHKVEIVPVVLQPHPDPKTTALSLVRVFGYNVVVRTKDWQGVSKAAYIVPDTLVPNMPPFDFLFDGKRSVYNLQEDGTAIKHKEGKFARVTVIRLRGALSHGLLVHVPDGIETKIGDDISEFFGVERYEQAMMGNTRGMNESPPSGLHIPAYDVENIQRYPNMFKEGEQVYVSEKIHGSSGRWVFHEDRMWAGSHYRWMAPGASKPTIYWAALENSPEVEVFCRANPGVVVYGEVYGPVQKGYHYGENKPKIAVFDLRRDGDWVDILEAKEFGKTLTWAPELGIFAFSMEVLETLTEGATTLDATHIREGLVVKPLKERRDPEIGRVQLKYVSAAYLEGKKRKRK